MDEDRFGLNHLILLLSVIHSAEMRRFKNWKRSNTILKKKLVRKLKLYSLEQIHLEDKTLHSKTQFSKSNRSESVTRMRTTIPKCQYWSVRNNSTFLLFSIEIQKLISNLLHLYLYLFAYILFISLFPLFFTLKRRLCNRKIYSPMCVQQVNRNGLSSQSSAKLFLPDFP